MVQEQLDVPVQKVRPDMQFSSCTKINLKWITEDDTGENLGDPCSAVTFLYTTPKARPTEERVDKLDFVKIKSRRSAKDTVRRMERLRENICNRHI